MSNVTNWALEDKNYAKIEAENALNEYKKSIRKTKLKPIRIPDVVIPTWILVDSSLSKEKIEEKVERYKKHLS